MTDRQSLPEQSDSQRILGYAHRVAQAWDILNRLWLDMTGVGPVVPALAVTAREQVGELQDAVQRELGLAVRIEDLRGGSSK